MHVLWLKWYYVDFLYIGQNEVLMNTFWCDFECFIHSFIISQMNKLSATSDSDVNTSRVQIWFYIEAQILHK